MMEGNGFDFHSLRQIKMTTFVVTLVSLDFYFPGFFIHFQTAQGIIHTGTGIPAHSGGRCPAIRADVPGQLHELVAILAGLLEFSMTVWANLPVLFDMAFAAR